MRSFWRASSSGVSNGAPTVRVALDPLPLDGEERVAHAAPQRLGGPLRVELAQCAQARDDVLAAPLGAGGATAEQAGEDAHQAGVSVSWFTSSALRW